MTVTHHLFFFAYLPRSKTQGLTPTLQDKQQLPRNELFSIKTRVLLMNTL
jgi:hypothetical protein